MALLARSYRALPAQGGRGQGIHGCRSVSRVDSTWKNLKLGHTRYNCRVHSQELAMLHHGPPRVAFFQERLSLP